MSNQINLLKINAMNVKRRVVQGLRITFLMAKKGFQSRSKPDKGHKAQLKTPVSGQHFLVSYASKGILPYRGLGSGIKRALDAWPEIDFIDDRDGCLSTATVRQNAIKSSGIGSENADGSPKSSPKRLAKQNIEY
jgi:hypothetical protein